MLHHQVRPVAIKATIENRYDVGMGKTGRRPGFALKPLERVWIGMARAGEHLDGHRAVKGCVATAVNYPKCPASQPVDDRILANLPRQYGECGCVLPGASSHRVLLGGQWVDRFRTVRCCDQGAIRSCAEVPGNTSNGSPGRIAPRHDVRPSPTNVKATNSGHQFTDRISSGLS